VVGSVFLERRPACTDAPPSTLTDAQRTNLVHTRDHDRRPYLRQPARRRCSRSLMASLPHRPFALQRSPQGRAIPDTPLYEPAASLSRRTGTGRIDPTKSPARSIAVFPPHEGEQLVETGPFAPRLSQGIERSRWRFVRFLAGRAPPWLTHATDAAVSQRPQATWGSVSNARSGAPCRGPDPAYLIKLLWIGCGLDGALVDRNRNGSPSSFGGRGQCYPPATPRRSLVPRSARNRPPPCRGGRIRGWAESSGGFRRRDPGR